MGRGGCDARVRGSPARTHVGAPVTAAPLVAPAAHVMVASAVGVYPVAHLTLHVPPAASTTPVVQASLAAATTFAPNAYALH